MLLSGCGVAKPYPYLEGLSHPLRDRQRVTCGSIVFAWRNRRPAVTMGGLIAYWTGGVPLDHQRGSPSQQLAGSSLGRFSAVFITNMNG